MKTAASLVFVTALFSGLPSLAQQCDEKCEIKVFMSAGCGSGIKVAPDPIFVGPGKSPEITWTIESPGWAFDNNGIVVQQATSETFEKAPPPNSKGFRLKHKNKGARAWKYDLNLVDTRDGPTKGQKCKHDPTIVDQ